jgi:CubicO group peptidase (beta-lactamase class C family)
LSAIFSLKRGGSFDAAGVARGGQDGIVYLQAKVFSPIGIAPTEWARDINGNPNFGGGASFTARDWARFGQFSYQYGAWNGVQILPAAAMRRCLEYRSGAVATYGFGWWLNRPAGNSYVATGDSIPWTAAVEARWINGGKIAPSAPDDMAIAFGAGNRKLYVSPSLKLSIAVIAGTNDDEAFLARLLN